MITTFVDPGRSSGIAIGYYSETEPWELIEAAQVMGGADGLIRFLTHGPIYITHRFAGESAYVSNANIVGGIAWKLTEFGAEKFVPYPTPGHSPTLDSSYPLVVEGVLIALGLMPDQYPHPAWQRSSEQYPFDAPAGTPKNKVLSVKKKLRQQWLKEHGLWQTGKNVGQPDADDANSAISHALVAMRKKAHLPTIRKYWPEDLED